MSDESAPPQAAPATPPVKRKRTTLKGLLIALAIGLLLVSFSISPLWRLFWYWPVYSAFNCVKIKDDGGTKREAWRWVEGRTVRIYQHPEVRGERTADALKGVQALLDDAGLAFQVDVLPMPADIVKAYRSSLVETEDHNGTPATCLSFRRLQAKLISLRRDDPRADILIINHQISESPWAFAMASFQGGIILMTAEHADFHTAKHETGHLMGYMMHDSFPLFVIGYPWEGMPSKRDTLMMLLSGNDKLSPRARDALRSFWRGMESKTGRDDFLKKE